MSADTRPMTLPIVERLRQEDHRESRFVNRSPTARLRNPDGREAADTIEELAEQNRRLVVAEHRAVIANVRLGKWMSSALDDGEVCEEMKADIREWFSAGQPPHALTVKIAEFGEMARLLKEVRWYVKDSLISEIDALLTKIGGDS